MEVEVRKVNYYVKHIGKSDSFIQHGKVYKCIAECYRNGQLLSLSVIDDSEEYYQYSPKAFEKTT